MVAEHRDIPIALVDEPPAPSRLSINQEKFVELVDSIREHGQLQPGGVVEDGGRFVVVYGHRRLLACRALELDVYRAYVYPSTSEAMLGAQLAENVDRHDLSPVEEAYWFAQLVDYVGGDTDVLALQVKRTREYVETRLNLLRGDPLVLDALQRERIGLGVAKLLNAYDNEADRRVLLDAAMAGGATTRLVAQWLSERRAVAASRGSSPMVDPTVQPTAGDEVVDNALRCVYCESDEEPYYFVQLWIHKSCLNILRRVLSTHLGGFHVQKETRAVADQPVARADR